MILTHVIGNLADSEYTNIPQADIDYLCLDYADAQKHLLRAATENGRDISIRLAPEAQLRGFHDGDILMVEGDTLVAIKILPVPALLAKPRTIKEATQFCYEIGNRHAPLYALAKDGSAFAVLYDNAMEVLFKKMGIPYQRESLVLEEGCRLKLQSGTHHHHHHEHNHEHEHHHEHNHEHEHEHEHEHAHHG